MLSKKAIIATIVIIAIIAAIASTALYMQSLASAEKTQLPTPSPTSNAGPTQPPTSNQATNPSNSAPTSASSSGNPNTDLVVNPAVTGAELYAQYCAGCHGNLASSRKIGRTSAQIQTAIQEVGSMRFLSTLTNTQIQAIAAALASPTTTPLPTTPTPTTPTQASPTSTSTGTSTPTSPSSAPSVPSSDQPYSNGQYRVIAWNDLGMHCYNPSFQELGVLPPYNNIWAQVIRIGEEPRIITSGVNVTYRIIDNTYSAGKTDFWSYEDKLFGVNLPDNIGLTGKGLSGTLEPTSSGSVNGRVDHYEAAGIPLTEYRDQDAETKTRYPFQLCVVTVTDSRTGTLLARTTVTAPVSTEMNCQTCHSYAGIASVKYPIAPTGKVDTNILVLHDYLHPQTPSLMQSRPVLCANCHGSNALGLTGKVGVPNLSNSMHSNHAIVAQITNNTEGCYSCHPGPETKCLRDVMSTQFGMTCQNCHGDLAKVATNPNPWLNEPRCDNANCHPSTSTRLNNPLFRHSTAMGGIYCEGCHGSTHAILPTTQANDAIQNMFLQGSNGPLKNCATCHGQNMGGGNPHIAEDNLNPNALLYVALPFLMTIPATAYIAAKKKLWTKLDFATLRSRTPKPTR